MNREYKLLSIILGMINELTYDNNTYSKNLAFKYMDLLQNNGCKLRKIDGQIYLIGYNPNLISRL